jgi:hypothetical protein
LARDSIQPPSKANKVLTVYAKTRLLPRLKDNTILSFPSKP